VTELVVARRAHRRARVPTAAARAAKIDWAAGVHPRVDAVQEAEQRVWAQQLRADTRTGAEQTMSLLDGLLLCVGLSHGAVCYHSVCVHCSIIVVCACKLGEAHAPCQYQS
jgi:hypothetical protein